MAKLPTSIEITDLSTKWGLVTVLDKRGAIKRQFVIDAEAAERVKAANNCVPPGCTDKEWFECRATLHTKCCWPGQAVVDPDGDLIVNHGMDTSNDRVKTQNMAVPPNEWALVDGVVYIDADVLRDMPLLQKG
jgi:hypothetical protein